LTFIDEFDLNILQLNMWGCMIETMNDKFEVYVCYSSKYMTIINFLPIFDLCPDMPPLKMYLEG